MAVFNWIRPGYEIVNVKFEWKVPNPFTNDRQERLDSSLFSPRETPDSKWVVKVSDMTTQLRIILYHYDCTSTKAARFVNPILVKMSILNKNDEKVFQKMLPFSSGRIIFELMLSREETTSFQQDDGSLTFCFKIYEHVKIDPVSPAVPSSAIDCSGELSTHLEHLFDSMKFSDVIFKVSGREFPAHKLILSTRTEYFAAMFNHSTKENLSGQIELKDIEPEVFEQLLRFIYTGRLDSTTMEKMAANLFIAADKYLLGELKIKCENHWMRNMSPDNCVLLLLYGDLINPSKYLKKAAKFFRRKPSQVMGADGWMKIKQENPTLLINIQEFLLKFK